MLGGGTFNDQNKILPGTYINYVSASRAGAVLSDRGVVTAPLILDWGPEQAVFEVTNEEFQKNCQKIFGYAYDADAMRNIRELFASSATKGIFYRLNAGEKASNIYAEAVYGGTRGNALKIVIAANTEDTNKFDVTTLLDLKQVDKQTVAKASELVPNSYVKFKADAALAATAGVNLSGGTNGEDVTGAEHSAYLAAVEPYSFHVMCCPVTDETTKGLYVAFTKRMRDEAGVKFQTVVYRKSDADYEGIISVENKAAELEQGLVYWVAGAEAACAVNKTLENRIYNGEFTVDTSHTQTQLSDGIQAGKFLFHKSGDDVRVLEDINTMVTYTIEKSEDFSINQVIRVLDQIGNDIAVIFNTKYLGVAPNITSGHVSLWNDILTYNRKMEKVNAIKDVSPDDLVVEKGESKRAVVVSNPVTPVCCMGQLYMTVIVR